MIWNTHFASMVRKSLDQTKLWNN